MLTLLASLVLSTFAGSVLTGSAPPVDALQELQRPIEVGYPTDLLPASKQFPGLPRARCYAPRRGMTWITIYSGEPLCPPGKYILASDDVMPNPDGWPYSPQGELVEIERWEKTAAGSGAVRGYFPIGQQLWTRWRGKAAWLVKAPIVTGGTYFVTQPTRFSCMDDVDIYVGPAAAGWEAAAFLEVNFSRRVRIFGAGWPGTGRIGAPARVDAGNGYLAKLQRSTLVNAQGLTADGVRHGFEAFGGAELFCGGLTITNPRGTVFGGHGMGAVALYGGGIQANGGDLSIGNGQGAYGDEAEIWMVDGAKMIWLQGASSVKVFDSKFSGPAGFLRNSFGEPVAFYGERCTFTAFSTTRALHFEGPGPFAIVPKLVDCALKESTFNPGDPVPVTGRYIQRDSEDGDTDDAGRWWPARTFRKGQRFPRTASGPGGYWMLWPAYRDPSQAPRATARAQSKIAPGVTRSVKRRPSSRQVR